MIRAFVGVAISATLCACVGAAGLLLTIFAWTSRSTWVPVASIAQALMIVSAAIVHQLWYSDTFWMWEGVSGHQGDPTRVRLALRIVTVSSALITLLPSLHARLKPSLDGGASSGQSIVVFFAALLLLEAVWMTALVLRGPRVVRAIPPTLSRRL